MTQSPTPRQILDTPTIRLRLLGMSDLHAHLRGFDYHLNAEASGLGLTRLATAIHRARRDAPNVLLFDNGDTIQGSPLGDWAAYERDPDTLHPMIKAFNHLGVDAATLGNHDFNYGLDYLKHSYGAATFPVVTANAVTAPGNSVAEDETLFPPWTILERELQDDHGVCHSLRIGVIGVMPPQTISWDYRHLANKLIARGIVEAAAAHVPRMRAAGADLVVALCHSGFGEDRDTPDLEQAATALARVPGIDAIIAGHTHGRFPCSSVEETPAIDPAKGCVHGVPCTMPGFWGSHLGQIDLVLRQDKTGWQVSESQSRLLTTGETEDPDLTGDCQSGHLATLAYLDRPIGKTALRHHTFLWMLGADSAQAAVATAQILGAKHLLSGTQWTDLPILSAVSPFKFGGKSGPEHFSDVLAGTVRMRDVVDLYLFPNNLRLIAMNGAGLREWLERAAGGFSQFRPGDAQKPLINPAQPGYEIDTIFGLTYRIDLQQPCRYDPASGILSDPRASRICDLSHDGKPVTNNDRFVLATNNYRLGGGGNYPGIAVDQALSVDDEDIRDLIAEMFETGSAPASTSSVWSFLQVEGASATIQTSPRARTLHDELKRLGLTDLGDREDGFAIFEYDLKRAAPKG